MENNNAKIAQRIMKAKTEDVLHSSGYASSQNPSGFGTATSSSFNARQSLESRRQFIRGYRDSKLVSSATTSTPRPKTFTPTKDPLQKAYLPPRPKPPMSK